MENKGHDKITAFDALFTNNHIQMLKILMPYFEPSMRKQLAVYIKYLELRCSLSYFDSHSHELYGCAGRHGAPPGGADPFGKEEFNIGKICSELIPYCTNDEKQKIEQISSLFHSMEMYKEMSQAMEVMKEFMPDMPADFLSNFMQNPLSGVGSGFPSNPGGYPPEHTSAAAKPDRPQDNSSSAGDTGNGIWDSSAAADRPGPAYGSDTAAGRSGLADDSEINTGNPNNRQHSSSSGTETPGSPGTQNDGNGMMNMLMNMLSPEQKAMLEMFGGNQTHESE